MSLSVTVYCASSQKVSDEYFRATTELADVLLERDAKLIYGGGAVGLMGTIADRYIELGGSITGVIPEFMVKVEWAHLKVSDLLIVHDMHERKKKLIEDTNAVVALPGGTGTLEELLEIITLKRLGKFNKPIIIINTNGYYNPLKEMLTKMVEEQFLGKEYVKMWAFIDSPEEFWKTFELLSGQVSNDIKNAQV